MTGCSSAAWKIYEYQPTKLHSKLLVMDDVVHIGSSNFDIRSLYLNMEMMLRVDDPEFASADAASISRASWTTAGDHARSVQERAPCFNRINGRLSSSW